MTLVDKLNYILENGSDPRLSEIHSSITWSPINYSDFNQYWEFSKYETIYYSKLAEWILEEIWDEEANKLYKSHRFIHNMDYIESLTNKMYEDGLNGYWGFKLDW